MTHFIPLSEILQVLYRAISHWQTFKIVQKWDKDIKVGDTVKMSLPFLRGALMEQARAKMEKVR